MKDKYRLKTNIKAFFYPDQWQKFYETIKHRQQPYYKIAINTGARINEIRHLKAKHIDLKRKTLTFYQTKSKTGKGKNRRPIPRTIPISTEMTQWLKRRIKTDNLKPEDTFHMPSTVAINEMIKKRCKDIGMQDWQDMSSHNIRKTHGNWLKTLGIGLEICNRLGHSPDVLIKHYVSPDIFNEEDRKLIRNIIGDLYT